MTLRIPQRARRGVVAMLALLGLGARPSAETILAGEPPELVERLVEERVLVLEDVGGGGRESFVVAYVLFERERSDVVALLRQAERQTEYRPELEEVRTVEELPDGRIDEQRLRILFRDLVYRLRYQEDPGGVRLEWRLDPGFDNDLEQLEGFWELYAFQEGPARTLGRFGSKVDVGLGVPRFVQRGLSRNSVLRYVENCRRWVDSGGEWRP